jgi:hypothetical protein
VRAYREEIVRTVALIEPVDAVEAEHRAAVLEWIDSGGQLYRLVPPDQPPMHLVSYFVPSTLLRAQCFSRRIGNPVSFCLPVDTVRSADVR